MTKKDVSSIFTQAGANQEKNYREIETSQAASEELVQLILRVSAETRRQIKIKAATQDMSMSEYLRGLIEEDLG